MLQPVDGALTTQSILPLLVLQDPHGLLQCLPASGRLALWIVMLIYLLTTHELIQQRGPDMPFNDVLV